MGDVGALLRTLLATSRGRGGGRLLSAELALAREASSDVLWTVVVSPASSIDGDGASGL